MVETLIRTGVDCTLEDPIGRTPLYTAAMNGDPAIVGWLIEAVQHAHTLGLMLRVDDVGDVVYSQQTEATDSGSSFLGVVNDPLKDLVIERHSIEGSETIVVQEYGCLN